jgi:uncharacterized protein YggE
MLIDRSQAILELIPNTEWHLIDDVLTVFTSGVKAPTMAEIDAKVIEMQETAVAVKIAKDAELAQAKEALQAKLVALGLTTDDLKALGL